VIGHEVLRLDAAAESARIGEEIRKTVLGTLRRKGVVLGLSGGIDSSVTAALCARALGADKVLGLLMPERDSSGDSLRLGQMLADHLGVRAEVEDMGASLEALGCYRRQEEAIRSVFPRYGAGWKCRLTLPSLIESDRLPVFQLDVESPQGERFSSRIRCTTTPGSISPGRVPITIPPSGVRPMLVSTTSSPDTAAMLAPFPRCAKMIFPRSLPSCPIRYVYDNP